MSCRRCSERGKAWEGSEPKCSFPDGGRFSPEGWNCGTANALRVLVRQDEEDSRSVWSEDCVAALLPWDGAFVLLTWYKHRGRTDGAWLVAGASVEWLTLDMAEDFLDWVAALGQAPVPTGVGK